MSAANNAVILARVSSKSQEDEGYSLDSQLKLLQGYCDANELNVKRTFKIAETASKQQRRKVFHELLVYISKNNIQHLTVEKTDRLTRNLRDAVAIDDWLEGDSQRMLHAVKENLRLHKESKSDVKFMWNIHLAVAKKYTDNLREEAMKGWAEKLAQGWLPAGAPTGYMTITANGKRIHVPNPKNYKLVQKLFKLYLQPGQSISTISAKAEEIGLKTRFGKPLHKSGIELMLKNPFYIGINRFNGRDTPGAQQPILSKDLFEAVQAKLHSGKPVKFRKHNQLFKNMLRCEDCNGILSWQLQKGVYYGSCQRRLACCKGKKYIREDYVEQLVRNAIERLVCPSRRVMEWVADCIASDFTTVLDVQEETKRTLESKIARLQRMQDTLYDDKLSGVISDEKYTSKSTQLDQELEGCETALRGADSRIQAQQERFISILKLSQNAGEHYQSNDLEDKRVVMIELFEEITTDGSSVSVKYTYRVQYKQLKAMC